MSMTADPATAATTAAASASRPRPGRPDLRRVLHLDVPVSVCLAERPMPIDSILDIAAGTIIEFEKGFDEVLSLYVNNRCIGTGHAVKVGENFGLKIQHIDSVADRAHALGGR